MQAFFHRHLAKRVKQSRFLTLIVYVCVIAIFLQLLLVLTDNKPRFPLIPLRENKIFALTLESPIDSQVISDNLLLVKGKTLPNTTIVIYTEKDISSIQSKLDGDFEGKIALANGLNTVVVKAFAENGEEKNIVLDIVNDSQSGKIKGESTSKDKEETSGLEKKQESQSTTSQPPGQEKKAEEASQGQSQLQAPAKTNEQPVQTAIVGNVEQVTSTSVVVEEKTSKQSIEAKVDKSTQITDQNDKAINLNKIKLNDKAAVITDITTLYGQDAPINSNMANSNMAEAKKATKIFVKQAESQSQDKRQAIQGVITSISGNLITLVHQIQTDRIYRFLVDKDTVVKLKDETLNVSDLKVSQVINVVGDLNNEGMVVAKLIHIIPRKSDIDTTPTPISNLSATPTSSLSPTVTSFPSGTISTTPSPIPTLVSNCTLLSAKWVIPSSSASQLYQGKLIESVSQGTFVGLNIITEGSCVGKQVNFEVRENDSLVEGGIDESANIQPPSIVLTADSQTGQTEWTAEWQQDCFGFCAPPEYYFNASLVGGNTVRSGDPFLITFGSVDFQFNTVNPSVTSDGYLNAYYQFSSDTTIPLGAYTLIQIKFWLDDQQVYSGIAGIQPQSPYVHNNNFNTGNAIIAVTPGSHKLKICIDTDSEVIEPNEGNNCKETVFSGPTSTPTTTSLVDFQFNTVNPSVTSNGYLNAYYQFSANTTIPLGTTTIVEEKFWLDERLIYTTGASISPQSPYVHNNNFNTGNAIVAVTPGSHRLKICIDTSNLIIEPNEANNCKETAFSGPTSTPTTSLVDLQFNTVNPGVSNGGYLSATYQFSAETTIPLGTTTIVEEKFWYDDQLIYTGLASISPQTPYVHNNSFGTDDALVPVTPGSHKLNICIDTANQIVEPNEANNCKEATFTY